MRYLDIALAAMLGLAAITGLSVWSPGRGDLGAQSLRTRSDLRDSLSAFVDARGMAWFASASVSEICDAVSASSNSSFALSAEVGAVGCGAQPALGEASAELAFTVASREVTLQAW